MRKIDTSLPRWPLFDAAGTRGIERRELARVAPGTLMQRAGLATAKLAAALRPDARRIWVLAGPGNNGGDGLDAAARLQAAGRQVTVHLPLGGGAPGSDARSALQRAQQAGVDLCDGIPSAPPPCELAIDALFGIGLARAPAGAAATAIGLYNTLPVARLAVDVPSALDADRGVTTGPAAVATDTLTMLTLKPGLFTAQGRDVAGRVWLEDLGCRFDDPPSAWLAPGHRALQPRAHAVHKGSFGDVAVIGGAPGMVGAAWLAASAALAAGAGRVYVSLLDEQTAAWQPTRPELMGRTALWRDGHALLRDATVVCGCGGGAAVQAALPTVLALAPRLVLDADALNTIAADGDLRERLVQRGADGLVTVLTPHPLEAARLLGRGAADVQGDRCASAQMLAEALQAVVVLKGSGSITAAPGCLPWLNASGNAALASPGTGDVLAGWIGGALAAARSRCSGPGAVQAEVAAVVARHGYAADRHGSATPLRAAALVEAMLALD